ncbi:MAG: peptidoglycan DD-metalloendopeptidase family protein [Porticoccus sp.]|nr:peptidoglycan DD-metalloendopeptidase family protein [Porticoccus sp.]
MSKTQLVISAILTLLLASPSLAGEKEDRIKLKTISQDIAKLQQSIKGSSKQQDLLNKALRKAELASAGINLKINSLETKLKSLNTELTQLHLEQTTLEASRKSQQAMISKQITAAYHLGSEEPIKLLLNQENPDRISRTLKYYDYFLQARGKKLSHYRETLTSLNKVEASISDHQLALSTNRDALKQEHQQLTERQQARREVLAQLNKQLSGSKQTLNKLSTERSRLESVLKSLQKSIAKLSLPSTEQPFAGQRGRLAWPVSGRLSKHFGASRNASITWDGWLLRAKEGSAVNTIHHGRVIFSNYLRGHGLLMIIDHGDGYMSLYAHNQVLLKETGEWVLTGETIAKVGNSGGREEHALYFEIRHNGKPANPKRWLKKKG